MNQKKCLRCEKPFWPNSPKNIYCVNCQEKNYPYVENRWKEADERHKKIAQYLEEGHTMYEAAKKFKVSAGTVKRAKDKYYDH